MQISDTNKKNKFSWFFIGFFLFMVFGFPIISISGIFGGLNGSIISLIFVIIFIKAILGVIKKSSFSFNSFDNKILGERLSKLHEENKINIPVDFYNPNQKVNDVSKNTRVLFGSKKGKKIIYYENGVPVYEK